MIRLTCDHCGVDQPDATYLYCVNCGRALDTPTRTIVVPPEAAKPIKRKTDGRFWGTLVMTVLLCILLIGGILAVAIDRIGKMNTSGATGTPTLASGTSNVPVGEPRSMPHQQPPPPQAARPQVASTKIVNEMREIGAGQVWGIEFAVPPQGGTLKGGFTAAGGGNDIDAWVVDASNYGRLMGGGNFMSVLTFNRVAKGKINTHLDGGSYWVVFSNKHAMWYSKQVAAEVDLLF
jgi:hypothetical protein